jgi:hypothetical protein
LQQYFFLLRNFRSGFAGFTEGNGHRLLSAFYLLAAAGLKFALLCSFITLWTLAVPFDDFLVAMDLFLNGGRDCLRFYAREPRRQLGRPGATLPSCPVSPPPAGESPLPLVFATIACSASAASEALLW